MTLMEYMCNVWCEQFNTQKQHKNKNNLALGGYEDYCHGPWVSAQVLDLFLDSCIYGVLSY